MLIAELTGLNIVVTPEVQDTITANLENVSVKAALDVILIPNGYNYTTQEKDFLPDSLSRLSQKYFLKLYIQVFFHCLQ